MTPSWVAVAVHVCYELCNIACVCVINHSDRVNSCHGYLLFCVSIWCYNCNTSILLLYYYYKHKCQVVICIAAIKTFVPLYKIIYFSSDILHCLTNALFLGTFLRKHVSCSVKPLCIFAVIYPCLLFSYKRFILYPKV